MKKRTRKTILLEVTFSMYKGTALQIGWLETMYAVSFKEGFVVFWRLSAPRKPCTRKCTETSWITWSQVMLTSLSFVSF